MYVSLYVFMCHPDVSFFVLRISRNVIYIMSPDYAISYKHFRSLFSTSTLKAGRTNYSLSQLIKNRNTYRPLLRLSNPCLL